MISKQLIAGLATLFAAAAANDACYNYGEPELVDMIAAHYVPSCLDTYTFNPDAGAWRWFKNTETLTFGTTLENDTNGCGDKTYIVECDNVDSSVVYFYNGGETLYISPRYVDGSSNFTSTCNISAYFSDYAPDASKGQSNWAEKEFYIDWDYSL